MLPFDETSSVGGNALAAMKHFNRDSGVARVQFQFGKAVRHRVIMLLRFNVIVDARAYRFPFRVLVTILRQMVQCRLIQFDEHAMAAARQFLEGAPIQIMKQLRDGSVGFVQAEESLVAQVCQYPPLSHKYAAFYFGLVARLSNPRGPDRDRWG